MKKLGAAWWGEFGWECMSWQGFLRKVSHYYDEVIVSAPEGHEALYKDFAHTYIPHNIKGVKDCWKSSGPNKSEMDSVIKALKHYTKDVIVPYGLVESDTQNFILYGNFIKEKYDIIIHARHPLGKRPQHAWPEEKWQILVNMLLDKGVTIAAIGTASYLPEGVVDKKGAELSHIMDLMASCKLVVGPSSGPMHLASLCGAKHLVWAGTEIFRAVGGTSRDRYETVWNPFKTACTVIDSQGWNPEPELIYTAIMKELKDVEAHLETPDCPLNTPEPGCS